MDFQNALNNRLPKHSPESDLWARIEDSLQAMEADQRLHSKLQQMPEHKPDGKLWQQIEHKLGQRILLLRITKFSAAAAAALLLIFTLPNFFTTENTTNTAQFSEKQNTKSNQNLPTTADLANKTTAIPAKNNIIESSKNDSKTYNQTTKATIPKSEPTNINAEIIETIKALETTTPIPAANDLALVLPIENATAQSENHENAIGLPENSSIKESYNLQNTKLHNKKYITPDDINTIQPFRNLALAMNYQPESMYNGDGNSLFHNIDLTASYNKEKVRFTTSIGMSYNNEQFELAVNYDQYQPVTAPGPNGNTDTISYTITNYDSELTGTEKHEYLTYGFGVARIIFKVGKLSSWFNAGAGVGVKLNTADIKKTTTEMLKEKYNAEVNSISINQPVYNPWNLNFVTGIDFNYQIFNKVSITFTPISRWYFKPVLTQNNQATDELTLGFRTGMKLDF